VLEQTQAIAAALLIKTRWRVLDQLVIRETGFIHLIAVAVHIKTLPLVRDQIHLIAAVAHTLMQLPARDQETWSLAGNTLNIAAVLLIKTLQLVLVQSQAIAAAQVTRTQLPVKNGLRRLFRSIEITTALI
jgi:hypothetical protein